MPVYWKVERKSIILHRTDIERVHQWALNHALPRDRLIFQLFIRTGIRSGELRLLRVEDIDFERCVLKIFDSKKHRYFDLPVDLTTLAMLKDYIGDRCSGYVFTRQTEVGPNRQPNYEKPLTLQAVHRIIKELALRAGVSNWKHVTPRMLRHYFAATWIKSGKNRYVLKRILRHESNEAFEAYLAKLFFFEDIQAEYSRYVQQPIIQSKEENQQVLSPIYKEYCLQCDNIDICKYVDQLASAPWASGCRFFKPKKIGEVAEAKISPLYFYLFVYATPLQYIGKLWG